MAHYTDNVDLDAVHGCTDCGAVVFDQDIHDIECPGQE